MEINSYVRGYHAYMNTRNPTLGQEPILKPEPSNYKDKHAVAVLKDDVIVGHVHYNLAPNLSQFPAMGQNLMYSWGNAFPRELL